MIFFWTGDVEAVEATETLGTAGTSRALGDSV